MEFDASQYNILNLADSFIDSVIGISSVWMIAGIRQYLLIDSWNKKYQLFVSRKNEIDNEIAGEFISDNDFQE